MAWLPSPVTIASQLFASQSSTSSLFRSPLFPCNYKMLLQQTLSFVKNPRCSPATPSIVHFLGCYPGVPTFQGPRFQTYIQTYMKDEHHDQNHSCHS